MSWIKRLTERFQNTGDLKLKVKMGEAIEISKKVIQKKLGIDNYTDYLAIHKIVDYLLKTDYNKASVAFREIVMRDSPPQTSGEIFLAIGTSMAPTINDGDILILSHQADNLREGDLVNFYEASSRGCERHLVHRFIGLDDRFLCFKGDYKNAPIERVRPECVTGKISGIIKKEKNPEIWSFLYDLLSLKKEEKNV